MTPDIEQAFFALAGLSVIGVIVLLISAHMSGYFKDRYK